MNPVVVKLDAIESGVHALEHTIVQIEHRLQALEAEVQPMINSWSGDAREQYLAQKIVWDNAARDLVKVLADLTNSVSASHFGYTDLCRLLQQAWQ